MIDLTNWTPIIPPEDKNIGYVGETDVVFRQFFLPDLAYQDYTFYLDLAFDLSTVTTTSQPREIQSTQQTTTEVVAADGTSVTATANTSKESYTDSEVSVDCTSETDIAPLTKLVQEDGILLTWQVLAQQTMLPGLLRATLRAIDDYGAIKKSSMMLFHVAPSVAAWPALPVPLTEHEQMERAMELALEQAAQATLNSFSEQLDEAVGSVTGFKTYVDEQLTSMTDEIDELEIKLGHLNEYVDDRYNDLSRIATVDVPGMVFAQDNEESAREYSGIVGGESPLRIVSATEEQINARENEHCPIVPANLEYAVKSVGDAAYATKFTEDEVVSLRDGYNILDTQVQSLDVRTATTDTLGLVLAAEGEGAAKETGIFFEWPHPLKTLKATDGQIDARENEHCPIVPANLEYAVKSVGDGYFATEDMVNANFDPLAQTVGELEQSVTVLEDSIAPKVYEHIATVTVAADEDGSLPKHIIFSADDAGVGFELESFYVKALIGATDGSAARLALMVNGSYVFGNASLGSMLSTTPKGWAMYYKDLGENEGALCIAQALANGSSYPTGSNVNNATFTGGVILPYMTQYKPVTKVAFYFNVGTEKTFTAGTKMELWGVRK